MSTSCILAKNFQTLLFHTLSKSAILSWLPSVSQDNGICAMVSVSQCGVAAPAPGCTILSWKGRSCYSSCKQSLPAQVLMLPSALSPFPPLLLSPQHAFLDCLSPAAGVSSNGLPACRVDVTSLDRAYKRLGSTMQAFQQVVSWR